MQQSYFDKNSYKKSFENTRLNQTWLKWTFADPFAKLLPTACFNGVFSDGKGVIVNNLEWVILAIIDLD
jgi:hypothetical protein